MQLAQGTLPALQVGDLPRPVAEHFKCHPAIIWLGTKELAKIVSKHSDIRLEQLQSLPYMIRDGTHYLEAIHPNSVPIFYRSAAEARWYIIGVKPASRGSEVWVQTFFYISDKKAARRLARASLLHAPKKR